MLWYVCHNLCITQVIADSSSGLLFKNKKDRKMVCVDPKVKPTLSFSLIHKHTHTHTHTHTHSLSFFLTHFLPHVSNNTLNASYFHSITTQLIANLAGRTSAFLYIHAQISLLHFQCIKTTRTIVYM